MVGGSEQTIDDRKFFTILLSALIALAWLVLWVWGQSPYARFLSHEHLGEVGLEDSTLVLVFVAGWSLMTVAMMLPTSLPLVTLFRTLVRQRPNRTRLVVLLTAGYLGIWILFGVLVHLGDWALHQVVEQNVWLQANTRLLAATTLMLAGLYQFTPLKYYCREKCRSPLSFIMEHWQGQHEQGQALLLGVHHGIFCLGCCWPLMLLMFAIGVGNIGWMLVLGTMMAVEKNMSWGPRLSALLGWLLIGWGLALVVASAS